MHINELYYNLVFYIPRLRNKNCLIFKHQTFKCFKISDCTVRDYAFLLRMRGSITYIKFFGLKPLIVLTLSKWWWLQADLVSIVFCQHTTLFSMFTCVWPAKYWYKYYSYIPITYTYGIYISIWQSIWKNILCCYPNMNFLQCFVVLILFRLIAQLF